MNRSLAVALLTVAAFLAGIGIARIGDDDPVQVRQPIAAEIEADVLVDAAVVEMRGYGPDGKPGVWLHDCEAVEKPKPGGPTLVCEQRQDAAK